VIEERHSFHTYIQAKIPTASATPLKRILQNQNAYLESAGSTHERVRRAARVAWSSPSTRVVELTCLPCSRRINPCYKNAYSVKIKQTRTQQSMGNQLTINLTRSPTALKMHFLARKRWRVQNGKDIQHTVFDIKAEFRRENSPSGVVQRVKDFDHLNTSHRVQIFFSSGITDIN